MIPASNSSFVEEPVRKGGSHNTKRLRKITLTKQKKWTGSYTKIPSGKVEEHTFLGQTYFEIIVAKVELCES